MSILSLLLALALVGFLAWLILQIPMPKVFQNVIVAILIVALIVYVLQQFGVSTGSIPKISFR